MGIFLRIFKMKNGYGLAFGRDIAERMRLRGGEEFDIFEIRPSLFLFVRREKVAEFLRSSVSEREIQEALKKSTSESIPNATELALLRKLDTFKYTERIPEKVDRQLTRDEMEILRGMIKKGFVRVYKAGKYEKTGVYDIPRKIYPLIKKSQAQAPSFPQPPEPARRLSAQAPSLPQPRIAAEPTAAQPSMQKQAGAVEHLYKFGYAIVDSESDAKALSSLLEHDIRGGGVLGVRGFDRRFYIAKRQFYDNMASKIKAMLRIGDKSAAELAERLKLDENSCRAILQLMNSEGDVIEKRRGYYGLV